MKPNNRPDPFLEGHYIRSPQHAAEVRRLAIGKALQWSLHMATPLTSLARLEAFKLLGAAGLLVDAEVTTRHLLGLYVEHVAPDLPPVDPYRVDEAA